MVHAETLRDSLLEELKDLYHAEKQLAKTLPKLAKAATHDDLRDAFETHFEVTQGHVARLEEAFEMLHEKVKAKPCAGMAGIIEEGSEIMSELDKGALLDARLVAAAQRAEHYEISAYGSVRAWAKTLGLNDLASLLEQTLDEEKAADEKLTSIAESEVNPDAAAGEAEQPEEQEAMAMAAAPRSGTRRQASTSRPANSGRTRKVASPARGRR